MARVLSLVMAGLLVCSVGCFGGRWEGEYKPPRPQSLKRDAYAQVQPTVPIPGLSDSYMAIAGGQIDDHGVYIHILIEMRENPEMEHSIMYFSSAARFGTIPANRWFALSSKTGDEVRVLPREAPQLNGFAMPELQMLLGHLDTLNAAPGLSRYNIVVWYHTEEQLRPGTYVLHTPDVLDDYPAHARRLLGIEAFDNTPIELRYADGFVPDDGDG